MKKIFNGSFSINEDILVILDSPFLFSEYPWIKRDRLARILELTCKSRRFRALLKMKWKKKKKLANKALLTSSVWNVYFVKLFFFAPFLLNFSAQMRFLCSAAAILVFLQKVSVAPSSTLGLSFQTHFVCLIDNSQFKILQSIEICPSCASG